MYPTTPFEQVRAAKARYCRYVDTKQWEAFSELLVANPRIGIYDTANNLIVSFETREAFVAACQDYLAGTQSIHQVHNEELTQVSATEIHAIWSMEDQILFPPADANADPRPPRHHGYGHNNETWVIDEGEWRIGSMDLHRTILEVTPK